ncbi:response regulator [Thalassotalea sp. PLHSN55]|uniref:response regulator n=1 Tax=Thalassotalea sp. PLHSN55 TaxID=3435888 RepID=UPI003F87EF23
MQILIVDDNNPVLEHIQSLLIERGFESVTASNGLDGLEKAQQSHYQLIIIDHLMPIMNGFQLAKNLRQNPNTAQTPILFMSTQDIGVIKNTAEAALVNALITKPIDENEFISHVYRLLDQNTQHQSL